MIAFYVPNPYNTLITSCSYYEMNYASPLPNSYIEAVPLSVMLSGLGAFGKYY